MTLSLSDFRNAVLDWADHFRVEADVQAKDGSYIVCLSEGDRRERIVWDTDDDDLDELWGALTYAIASNLRPLGSRCLPVPIDELQEKYSHVVLRRSGPFDIHLDFLDSDDDEVFCRNFEWAPGTPADEFTKNLDEYISVTLNEARQHALRHLDLDALQGSDQDGRIGDLVKEAQGGNIPALLTLAGLVQRVSDEISDLLKTAAGTIRSWCQRTPGLEDFHMTVTSPDTVTITLTGLGKNSIDLAWKVTEGFDLLPQALEATWQQLLKGVSVDDKHLGRKNSKVFEC